MQSDARKVLGEGPCPARVMLVGEAPGTQEAEQGRPFVGKSGAELNGQYLPLAGLTRGAVYVTNLWKYNPPGNRDPSEAEIAQGLPELLAEIERVDPLFIVPLGRIAAGALLGRHVSMDKEHGVACYWTRPDGKLSVVIPCYHPAAGLHDTAMMTRVRADFFELGRQVRGLAKPPRIEPVEGWYERLTRVAELQGLLGDVVAVDCETHLGQPFTVQFSSAPGMGFLVDADVPLGVNEEVLAALGAHLAQPHVTTVMHNARFDIKVLLQLGIHPAKVVDTMTMAYLLGGLPQGLKALAYRVLHVRMQEYKDVVEGSENKLALEWLAQAAAREYPMPDPVLEYRKGKAVVRKPQALHKRLRALVNKAGKNPELDVAGKLRGMKGLELVVEAMGDIPESSLALVPDDKLVEYACADPDVTLRLYCEFMPRVEREGLGNVLARDMAAMVMVVAMEQAGMALDVARCRALSQELFEQTERLMYEINDELREKELPKGAGKYLAQDEWFNPNAPAQVMRYLNTYGRYPKSTEAKYLASYRAKDPVLGKLAEYKHLAKLRSTYAEALPRKVDAAGRVHTDLAMTVTETGRLASRDPNLANIPVRDELGNRIRSAFVAGDGRLILSLDYCLAAGHGVITVDGVVPIENIRTGAHVLSCAAGASLCFGRVTATAAVGKLPAYIVQTDTARVVCSGDHTWMLYNGTMRATRDLQPGDRLAHVKDGFSGRYPTWYVRSHCNYRKKHSLVAASVFGERPADSHVDHINGDFGNWHAYNLRYLPKGENSAQGGQRYWRAVKEGRRSDELRLKALVVGLSKRRSYVGKDNPNFGKLKGAAVICPQCGVKFYKPPSMRAKYCSSACYHASRIVNHRVVSVEQGEECVQMYQITVEGTHNYVLDNGMVSGNSQIELRISAHVSGDEALIRDFITGIDPHTSTAATAFGIPYDQVDAKRHRYPMKRAGFGILYGISAKGLLELFESEGITGWTEQSCQELLDMWFGVHAGVERYMFGLQRQVKADGRVFDMFGRYKLVPEVHSVHYWLVSRGMRQACNYPIQAGAQEIIKEAMGQLMHIVPEFNADGHVCMPLMQIHDELLFEVDVEQVAEVAEVFKAVMENVVELCVPLKCDVEVGPSWGELKGGLL